MYARYKNPPCPAIYGQMGAATEKTLSLPLLRFERTPSCLSEQSSQGIQTHHSEPLGHPSVPGSEYYCIDEYFSEGKFEYFNLVITRKHSNLQDN